MFGRRNRQVKTLESRLETLQGYVDLLTQGIRDRDLSISNLEMWLGVYSRANENLREQQGRRQQLYLSLLEENSELRDERDDAFIQLDEFRTLTLQYIPEDVEL